MSEYQANDTFLSRVFGLHSVYNQINDNYHYYEDEEDQTGGALSRLGLSDIPYTSGNSQHAPPIIHSENDLESDSEFDGISSAEMVATFHNPPLKQGFSALQLPLQLTANAPSNVDDNNRGAVAFELPLYHKRDQGLRLLQNINTLQIQPVYQKGNRTRNLVIPPREKALYLWANIINMDEFLQDIYYYYRGNGYLNIALTRVVDLLILVFVLGFTIFLKYGIDYEKFLNREQSPGVTLTLHSILKPLELPPFVKFLLFGFTTYVILRLIQLYFDLNYKLREIHNFYKYLMNISDDAELSTISWSTLVERLMLLKDYNGLTTTNDPHYLNDLSSKVRLDAHDIANRIMRKENYMIGLINKNVLNLNLTFIPGFLKVNTLTRTLEWNLQLCINNFIFNQHGQINPNLLKEVNRNKLASELKYRFQMAAIINLILCPFIVTYFILLYFFKYFNEYKNNPGSLMGLRQYTPLAEWKLREFNELQHFFQKRIQLSIGPANSYINQFPRGFLVVNVMKLANFISGSFLAILVIYGLWFDDEEHNFWSFEITENKSSLFYISIFGTIWAITNTNGTDSNSSGSQSGESKESTSIVYDPEAKIRYVSQFTHYLPTSWNGRLHTIEVKNEFCDLYRLKVLTIINELMSLVLTPFILWFNIANSSSSIIDFFRDYSIHVDGLGYVCYFAMFNFEEKDKNMMFDLNRRKRKRRMKRRAAEAASATELNMNPGDVELDSINNRKLMKAKLSDDEDSSDDVVDYDSYQNDKMIKSYMYFLESYDDKKSASNKKLPSNLHELRKEKQHGRAPVSFALKSRNNTGRNGRGESSNNNNNNNNNNNAANVRISNNPHLLMDQSITESMYNINYKFDDLEEHKPHKSGALGMLNQFYKHADIGR